MRDRSPRCAEDARATAGATPALPFFANPESKEQAEVAAKALSSLIRKPAKLPT